jgi:hypothetical protein
VWRWELASGARLEGADTFTGWNSLVGAESPADYQHQRQALETVFVAKRTGDAVGWLPQRAWWVCDPTGRTWAGNGEDSLYLFRLEGR